MFASSQGYATAKHGNRPSYKQEIGIAYSRTA
jgi:hypothetical protein